MRQFNDKLLRLLIDGGVDFVIVGGIAAIAHGALRTTLDLDVVAAFNHENMGRLLAALHEVHPRNAARPDLGEIEATAEELARYRNLYLVTDVGELDVLGELPPIGGYAEAAETAVRFELFGKECAVLGLDQLIAIKEHLGRAKDLEALRELRAIRERLRGVRSGAAVGAGREFAVGEVEAADHDGAVVAGADE